MNRLFFLFSLILACSLSAYSQVVPSSCNVPPNLEQAYQRDIVNLAIQAMHEAQSPDTQLSHIPTVWTHSVKEDLAAIFNVSGIPERDSVFDLYCVHDNTGPYQSFQGYLLEVDTSYSWTQAWQNSTTLTGNPNMDGLLAGHQLHLTAFYNWSIGSYALLAADSFWNMPPLLDSLSNVAGVLSAEDDAMFGIGGKIIRTVSGNDRLYDFYYEWGDCPAGCIYYRVWHFKVSPNCMVEYLGVNSNASASAMDPASNCNITNRVDDPDFNGEFVLFPNPTSGKVYLQGTFTWDAPYTATLYDVTGRKLFQSGEFNEIISIDLSDYSPGLYSVVLQRDHEIVSVKKVLKE
jgi:hypothetical protein